MAAALRVVKRESMLSWAIKVGHFGTIICGKFWGKFVSIALVSSRVGLKDNKISGGIP